MQPGFETILSKKLVGMRMNMSLVDNKTVQLFQTFMPRRNEVLHRINADIICMQVFPSSYSFSNFDPGASFDKWSAVEVSDVENIPEGMETYTLHGGLYAVFIHIGDQLTAADTFRYIFSEWLPNSDYELDNREHFEILGSKYKRNDPTSEEEVWIPVRRKG